MKLIFTLQCPRLRLNDDTFHDLDGYDGHFALRLHLMELIMKFTIIPSFHFYLPHLNFNTIERLAVPV
jgi:hypothetical protein